MLHATTETRRGLPRILHSSWLRPLNDSAAINDLLAQANPLWSLDQVRARVVAVTAETADTRTVVLRPNRHWQGHAAGQHVVIEVEIDGVRRHRTYTLSSAPGDASLTLTVKRQRGGLVSRWLHDELRVGDVIGLSPARGGFVLPALAPAKLLMLSAGSGITPVMAILRDLRNRGYAGHVLFLHSCRDADDAIFGEELALLAREWPALQLEYVYTAETGRLDAAGLARRVPDWRERHALLCGPAGFMQALRGLWQAEGIENRLQSEHFGLAPAPASGGAVQAQIRYSRSGIAGDSSGSLPLLVEAETAGLKPRHGCRIGICQSCKCRKITGTVENLLTGAVSSEADEMIQLCISAARSDVVLDL